MKFLSGKNAIITIILLCIISRLPQLMSEKLILDGDECVVALMAKHLYIGKEFPVFFYGQAYGLSFFECLFIIPFYMVLGYTTIAVKLAMLTMWTIGVLFLYKTMKLLHTGKNKLLPFLMILLFIWFPAWAVWSMKARGGYLTAFMFSSVFMYLTFAMRESIYKYFLLGLVFVVIMQSSFFWLIGISPLLAYRLIQKKSLVGSVGFLLSSTVLFLAFYFYKQTITVFYSPPFPFPEGHLIDFILRIPEFLFSTFHGKYFFFMIQKPYQSAAILAGLFTAVVIILPFIGAYKFFADRKRSALFITSVLFIPPMLAYTIWSIEIQARYLLPVFGFAVIALMLLLEKVRKYRPMNAGIAMLVLVGVPALIAFEDFEFTQVRDKSFRATLKWAIDNDIRYTFGHDPFLVWQTVFYSNEQVLCREVEMPGRYPEYTYKINDALDKGIKTALIGYEDDYWGLNLPNVHEMNGYYYSINVPKDTLKINFRF